jgi:site-specific DNA recombinase
MHIALYARVSTSRQAQAQTIEQQLERLRAHLASQGAAVDERNIFRDAGYSGASLSRPGLDQLRDRVALAEFDRVVVTAPDRLARKYVHQVLLIEELQAHGCTVEFLERPMSQDPHDQLLLQIRGAVAEYERTLICDRMRRGRLTHLRAGQLLPWSRAPLGYRLDPEHPRDPAYLHVDPVAAAVVQEMFACYLEPRATVHSLALRLTQTGMITPMGKPRWNVASVRGILKNPAYTGTAYGNRTRIIPATSRKSALLPVGPGCSYRYRPREEWIGVPVPALISQEVFDRVQEKLAHNQQCSARNNTHFPYLLRAMVSCGRCRLGTTARTMVPSGQAYYVCQGRSNALRRAQGQRCTARYIPGRALDDLVWQDLCTLLLEPEHLAAALRRAHGGQWLPQELQARQATLRHALTQLDTSQQRLLDAYLAGVLSLSVFERKRDELTRRQEALQTQQRQLDAVARQHITVSAVADSLEAFCAQVRDGLHEATFEQRRALVELLIDRVIVTDGDVEIRYVFPTVSNGPPIRFSHLRVDYLHLIPASILLFVCHHGASPLGPPLRRAALGRDAHLDAALTQEPAKAAAIIPAVRHQLLGPLLRTAPGTYDVDRIQGLFGELHLRLICAVEMEPHRQTIPFNGEHPLGAFALLREAHLLAALLGRCERAVEEGH